MSGKSDREESPWLDTETKPTLEPTPPEGCVASGLSGFTLVLLQKGFQHDRLTRALGRIWRDPERATTPVLFAPCPIMVRSGLALEEAIVGQFELICCDAISVFVRDEIAADGATGYLRGLYSQLRSGPEFQPVFITITFVPDTDAGRRFCDQFLSTAQEKKIRYGDEGGASSGGSGRSMATTAAGRKTKEA